MSAQNRSRVLLIEDDAVDAEAICRALKHPGEYGYEVVTASKLSEAKQTLGESEFDVVVLDLGLPDSSGLSALKTVQEMEPTIPVIVCSGLDDHSLALEAVQSGAQDYLLKGHIDGPVLGRALSYAIERKRLAGETQQLAYSDTLTGLPNRLLLYDRMNQALAFAERNGKCPAILYLDLDGFKSINDRWGHAAGDEALRTAAARMQRNTRGTDTVARIGGDEFVVLLSDMARPDDASVVASKLLEILQEPIVVEGKAVHVGASIGIAVWPGDGEQAELLMQSADSAMYAAKNTGGATYQYHSPAMAASAVREVQLQAALEEALRNSEFVLHYQPIVDIRSGSITRMEALIRWNNPECGLLSPGEFIGVAEKTRCIVPIGTWVVEEACRQNREWRDAGLAPLSISVNLSPIQLNASDVPQVVASALEQHRLEPADLQVEVTESCVLANKDRAVTALFRLQDLGVTVAIDDFGTGYASLSHLKEFPVDTVKVDRSFVRDLSERRESAEIVKGVIAISHGLGKRVVAEGVETEEQLAFLEDNGCDLVQGYLFSRPVPADAVANALVQIRQKWANRFAAV